MNARPARVVTHGGVPFEALNRLADQHHVVYPRELPWKTSTAAAREGDALVFHGTSMRWGDSLRARGLKALDGLAPFVALNPQRAGSYAFRAVADDIVRGHPTDRRGLILVIRADPACLRQDPWMPDEFALADGCEPGDIVRWLEFDAGPMLDTVTDDEMRALSDSRERVAVELETGLARRFRRASTLSEVVSAHRSQEPEPGPRLVAHPSGWESSAASKRSAAAQDLPDALSGHLRESRNLGHGHVCGGGALDHLAELG